MTTLALIALLSLLAPAGDSPCDLPEPQGHVAGSITIAASMELTWQESARASHYDLYLGTTNPPPLLVSGVTTTRYTVANLAPGTNYYWYVVAHAACDPTRTSSSIIKTFVVPGTCAAPSGFALTSPANTATEIAANPTLSWSSSANASSYDVYLGRTSPPALFASDVMATSLAVPKLLPATTYHWRVVANSACNPSSAVASSVASFATTQRCSPPSSPAIAFVPSGRLVAGQTYAISWSESSGLDAGGSYLVERATDAAFGSIVDRQQTTSNGASFLSRAAGTYYHRVRAISGCDAAVLSGSSDVKSVEVGPAEGNVIFTVLPRAVITKLGDKLEDQKTSFTIENIGESPVQVLVGRRELSSVPFFSIIDPLGEDAAFVTLQPHKPKTLEVRFSGPPNDRAGNYQGLISLASTGEPFPSNPLAYVNLKVGGEASAAPQFLVEGIPSEYAFFPPASGDDSSRPAISVDILNSGTTPMELAAEVGPELWLSLETGWNTTPIAANSFIPVRLSTRRNRAPNGSALPRYTYLTVRNRSGQSARLLVQDNTAFSVSPGRSAPLDADDRSFIVPNAITLRTPSGNRQYSRIRITSVGGDSVQTDLFFTPTDRDGFDSAAVKRATVVIPANDVVNLTDPLVQLFGLSSGASGQIEVRAPQSKLSLLTVTATIETAIRGGGTFSAQSPVLIRGEGARVGSAHLIAGTASNAEYRTSLSLIETTGREKTTVRVATYDRSGASRGTTSVEVPRYGRKSVEIPAVDGARIELSVESGGGAVAGIASIASTSNDNAVVVASQPASATAAVSTLGREKFSSTLAATAPQTYVVPGVINGSSPLSGQANYRTSLALTAAEAAATQFKLTYRDDERNQSIVQNVSVPARQTIEYANVVEELFRVAAGTKSRGSIAIETDAGGRIGARVTAKLTQGAVGDALPVISSFSEAITGAGFLKPVFGDGLEQSLDATRGSRSVLTLTEHSGEPSTVNVRLYEAGNRLLPIAEKDIDVPARGEVRLDTVFNALGLDSEERRKDRTNVLAVVAPKSSRGLVSAMLTTIDNRTGETKNTLLVPAGGIPATGVQKATPSGPAPSTGRRRGARRG